LPFAFRLWINWMPVLCAHFFAPFQSHMSFTPAALIFDLDGTLVDSETHGLDVMHEEACKMGVSLSLDEAHEEFRGKKMALCVQGIARRLPQPPPPDFEATFTAHLRRCMAVRFREALQPMPGALDLLSQLTLPYAIATNGPREKAELTLGLTGLRPYFQDHLYCAYDVGSFKPDPDLFWHAAQRLGVPPSQCAVVEDSLPGLQAGLAAGMHVYSLCDPARIPALIAARIQPISGLPELQALLS
jgi:HAD superfamily hydrolase (TIGR01509 family)